MRDARFIPSLLAGFLAFDLLINLPGVLPGSLIASLLVPSIDFLIVAAALFGIAQTGARTRVWLRATLSVLLSFLLAYETGARFGFGAALGLLGGGSVLLDALSIALCLMVLAAAAGVAFLLSALVLRGFSSLIVRSSFLAVVAVCAMVQVLSGRRVFGPSALPHLARDIVSLFAS
jgi:hypothetical protein